MTYLTTLCKSASHDSDSRSTESKLVKEDSWVDSSSQEEVARSEKGGTRAGCTKCKGVSCEVESNTSATSIEKILEHRVVDVLLTNTASTEHGKPSLHEEDESSSDDERKTQSILVSLIVLLLKAVGNTLENVSIALL